VAFSVPPGHNHFRVHPYHPTILPFVVPVIDDVIKQLKRAQELVWYEKMKEWVSNDSKYVLNLITVLTSL
jgi:hypothetical protein